MNKLGALSAYCSSNYDSIPNHTPTPYPTPNLVGASSHITSTQKELNYSLNMIILLCGNLILKIANSNNNDYNNELPNANPNPSTTCASAPGWAPSTPIAPRDTVLPYKAQPAKVWVAAVCVVRGVSECLVCARVRAR